MSFDFKRVKYWDLNYTAQYKQDSLQLYYRGVSQQKAQLETACPRRRDRVRAIQITGGVVRLWPDAISAPFLLTLLLPPQIHKQSEYLIMPTGHCSRVVQLGFLKLIAIMLMVIFKPRCSFKI